MKNEEEFLLLDNFSELINLIDMKPNFALSVLTTYLSYDFLLIKKNSLNQSQEILKLQGKSTVELNKKIVKILADIDALGVVVKKLAEEIKNQINSKS